MSKKKQSRKSSDCKCLDVVQKELAKQNARLATGLSVNFKTGETSVTGPYLQLEKIEPSKKRLPTLLPTYCPFCGKNKFQDPPARS